VQILREIRDEVRATNGRLDQTNECLDETNERLGRLERRVTETEIRLASELTALNVWFRVPRKARHLQKVSILL